MEDLQLAVESYQKKINLTKPDTYRSDISKKTPYTAYRDIQGIIYQDDMDRNRLMRTDELHKFSDGTLNHVRTSLNDIATGIQMEYLSKRKWTKQEKQRAQVMIKAINKKLKYRRLMRSLEKFIGQICSDRDGILKRSTMYFNLWRYKVVRHRYSNPMIQPEPEGSTQGYPLVSVEVLRFYTSAGNPVKDIILKLNLPDHRKLKDGGEGMSMLVQKSQVHKMVKSQDGEMRLCLVDDLKVFKITISLTTQDKGTSSCLKSKDTTTYSQDKRHEVYELKTKDKA
ncbi:hypothetical protein Tco_0939482 [Tanacetum coccineum]|uniref:Uncharacterized protein n=1 Tax=Tanacetum coccineum TaxID=301880 RepID=A0ABQ5DML5_9ASTR